MQRGPFAHPVYYVRRRREADAGGSSWAFTFHDAGGKVLLEARFPEVPKEAVFFEPGGEEAPLVRLKAWRWFWWNGRYDVVDTDTGRVLATLRRMGGIEGPDRRSIGRVCNAMPVRKSLAQWFFIGILDIIFTSGDSAAALSVDAYRIEAGGRNIGTLRRVRLPFDVSTEPVAAGGESRFRRWLGRFRRGLKRRLDGGGWLFDFSTDPTGGLDPRVRLAAGVLRVQIEERYH